MVYLRNFIIGLVVYLVANMVIDTMITGTATSDTLIKTITPIGLAIVPLAAILAAVHFKDL